MSRSTTTVYLSLRGYIHAETEKAILFETTEVSGCPVSVPKKEWFPLSQISRIIRASKQAEPGTEAAKDEISAAEWICAKKNLSEDDVT